MSMRKSILALAAVLALTQAVCAQQGYPARLDIGTTPPAQELAQFFAIPPDGRGLPPGRGTYEAGQRFMRIPAPCVTATSCKEYPRPASAATS